MTNLPRWLHWSVAPGDATPVQRRNFLNVQIDGIGVGLATAAAPFLPVFLARLGASNFQVGLLTAMPAVTGLVLALAVGRFLQSRRQVVPWFSRARFVSLMAYAATGLVTLAVPGPYRVAAVLAIWAAATLPQIIVNVAFSVVMNGVAGPKGRYELMSRRWSVLGLSSALTVAVAGQVLEAVDFPLNYQMVFLGLSAGALVSLAFSSRIELPDNPPPGPAEPGQPWRLDAQVRALRDMLAAQPAFTTFVAKRFIFLSGISLAAPIFPLFFVRQLEATDAQIGLISTAQTLTLLVGYRLWTRLSQARGSRPVLLWTTLGLGLYPALTALSPRVELVIGLAALAGVFQAGLDLVFFDELLRVVPPEQTAVFVSLAQSLQHLAAIAAPLVGTWLADEVGLSGALFAAAALRLLAWLLFRRRSLRVEPRAAA